MPNSCKWYIKLCIFSIIAFFLTGCGIVEDIERDNIHRVKNINSNEVSKVTIYEIMRKYKSNKKLIKVIDKSSDIGRFIESLRSIKKVHMNHGQFPNMWSVEIEFKNKEQEKEKLNILQRTGFEGKLYIECLGHSWLGGAATAVSFDFFDWMDKNIWSPTGRP